MLKKRTLFEIILVAFILLSYAMHSSAAPKPTVVDVAINKLNLSSTRTIQFAVQNKTDSYIHLPSMMATFYLYKNGKAVGTEMVEVIDLGYDETRFLQTTEVSPEFDAVTTVLTFEPETMSQLGLISKVKNPGETGEIFRSDVYQVDKLTKILLRNPNSPDRNQELKSRLVFNDVKKKQQAIETAQKYVKEYLINSKNPRWNLDYANWRPVEYISFGEDPVDAKLYWNLTGRINTISPFGNNVLITYGIKMDENYRIILSDIGE